jgi:predicted outer membrane repeat protein
MSKSIDTRVWPRLLASTLIAAGLVGLPARPAQAAGTVGSGTAASCTETALETALAGGGTITFNCGGPATIVFTSEKQILADTVIDGGGLITLSGNGLTRLFQVGGYRFEARAITLTRGFSLVGGGLIESAGGRLHFVNATLSDSQANDQGGAIYCFVGSGGSLSLTNTVVSGNRSDRGSGLYVDGCTTSIRDSRFLNNSAEPTGTVRLGGGLFAAGPVAITATTFSGNTALDGGALYVANGYTVTVAASTFTNNTAGYGGAIENSGAVTVTDSLIERNTVTGAGGGVWNLNGTIWLTRTTLQGNTAGEGGGLSSYGNAAYLQDVNLIGNRANSTDGGGIHHRGGTLFATNATLAGNFAQRNGGGLYQASDDNLVLNSVTVSANRAIQYGGGLYHQQRFMVLNNVTLGDNDAGLAGPALYSNATPSPSTPGVISAANVVIFGTSNNCGGLAFTSLGHNLVAGTCGSFDQPTDQVVTDAGLGPLTHNGGAFPMLTHLPLPGSPLINAGDPGVCASYAVRDQRGAARVGGCDIGAVEFGSVLPMLWLVSVQK